MDAPRLDRRSVLGLGLSTAGIALLAGACAAPQPTAPPRQPVELLGPDANGVRLPANFSSRVVARSLRPVEGNGHVWHIFPDGGAVFPLAGGGWTYVSNCEFPLGGVGALDFDRDGRLLGGRPLLFGQTSLNCAGGTTPWGTWLTCEEFDGGRVWEVDPVRGTYRAHDAMGVFSHEAAACDPVRKAVYLTEDKPDGRFYRFVPTTWGDLSRGTLSVARVDGDGRTTWLPVPNPAPGLLDTPTRRQVAASTEFKGGEGTVYKDDHVYFTTKGDNRVWDLDLRTDRMRVVYDRSTASDADLSGVDNVVAAGDALYVAEDGGNLELVLVGLDGRTQPCLRVEGQEGSEITGPAFDPSGTRLYFSSQRGGSVGITYEVTGPFAAFRDAVLAG